MPYVSSRRRVRIYFENPFSLLMLFHFTWTSSVIAAPHEDMKEELEVSESLKMVLKIKFSVVNFQSVA